MPLGKIQKQIESRSIFLKMKYKNLLDNAYIN